MKPIRDKEAGLGSGIRLWGAASLGVLLLGAWLSGCAHTYVVNLNAADPGDFDENRTVQPAEKYTGIWRSEKHEETWYILEKNGGRNVIVEDLEGNTGDFLGSIVASGVGELLFMGPNIETFVDYSMPVLNFADDQPVVQPVFRMHGIERVGPKVVLSELRPAWIRKMARNRPEDLRFLEAEDTLLITTEPKTLIQLLERENSPGTAFRIFRVLEYVGGMP